MTFSSRPFRKLICVSFATSLGFASTVLAQEPRGETPQAPKIVRKSGGVLQGSATKRVEPAYPPLAKAAHISGSVVVEVTVDEEGKVISARAISGHPLLKDTAVSAARGWTFTPTKLQGDPVKVIGTITFNFQLGQTDDDPTGITTLEKEVAASPNSAELVHRLGKAYLSFLQEEKAVEVFKRAIELKPDFAEAYCDLGRAYFELDRYEESVASANALLRIDPRSKNAVCAYLMIGTILFKQDRVQESIENFKEALKIPLDSADADSDAIHICLGYAYVKAGDKKSALREYEILQGRSSEAKGPDLAKQLKSAIDAMP